MLPDAEHLLRLYPRAWRERYGEEFLATVGHGTLRLQQVVDIVSGAIDAWFSADVRSATAAERGAKRGGTPMALKSLLDCGRTTPRYTRRDSLIGASVMLFGTLILTVAGLAARRSGWPATGEILKGMAFPGSLTLSMPFWVLRGQPWRAQVALVGAMLLLLTGLACLAALL